MEGIQVSNFNVKSRFHNYNVSFVDNSLDIIKSEVKKNDVIIIDTNVKNFHPEFFKEISRNNLAIEVEAIEKNKSYKELIPVIELLIQNGFRKNHRLIGVGGGIIQDITAFISSIMYRGVNWILFPTTLLAQGDSCIGSKTSINFNEYKNQLGGFYPPNEIYIDTNFLILTFPLEDTDQATIEPQSCPTIVRLLFSCSVFINFSISNDKFSILKSLTIELSTDESG